jgi:type I restriction enzyme S subunit
MKLETFFEKFDQFADAPDAVEKMRELLLNFAVTGRLSEQRAGDAPVSELIDALSAAKARLGKTGRRGSAAAVPPDSIIDRPINAPAHWAWVPLNEIGAMSGGMTPSKDKSAFWDGNVNWFSSKDIKADELTESELKITREATRATGLQVYSPGCLVIVARSGILKRTLPVSILRVEGTVNQDLKVLSPFVGGIERYLQIMLRGMTGFILAELVKTGMTVQSLKYEEFEAQPFPLPPLAEQKRIVAKVDELMALCDRLEAQQQERETRHAALARASLARFADTPTPANLHLLFHPSYAIPPADLRKSILTLAVQGKLVPQDPNDEPAEVTFRKLAAAAIEPDEDGFPSHWLSVPLGRMGEWRGGGTPSKSRPEFWKGDLPWVSPKDMKVLHISDAQDHISKAAVEGSSVRLIPPGSLLMVVRGMILARAFPVALAMREVTINQDMKALLPCEPKTKEYLLVALRAFEPDVLTAIEHSSHGTCKLKTEFLHDFLMPIPPLAEQRRIVAKVEQLMALVDALETQVAAARATAANLLSALVAELTATPGPGNEQ